MSQAAQHRLWEGEQQAALEAQAVVRCLTAPAPPAAPACWLVSRQWWQAARPTGNAWQVLLEANELLRCSSPLLPQRGLALAREPRSGLRRRTTTGPHRSNQSRRPHAEVELGPAVPVLSSWRRK